MLRRAGLSLIGQTDTLVPADKALYALRDDGDGGIDPADCRIDHVEKAGRRH